MSYTDSVQRAIDYIEAHLDEELDLSGLAEEAYTSVAQLYRMFCALTGHPVKDYIRKRRISVAADCLRHSKRTVEELAWESGFESYHAFAKVFKKIVGLTPSAYRSASIHYSFEPIRLRERFVYAEDKEQSERFPDIKVIRFMPEMMYEYLHVSERESGMEDDAFRYVRERLTTCRGGGTDMERRGKTRIFGSNVDLPDENGLPRFGYRMLIMAGDERDFAGCGFSEAPFPGGLYAVRKIYASSPEAIQDGWNRLLSEWLPRSAFELGDHLCIEEFVAYNGKAARMNLFLPVRRNYQAEPFEIVHLPESWAFSFRGYGAHAQRSAEQRLIDWHQALQGDGIRIAAQGNYYMSYHYCAPDSEAYWWENGIRLAADPEAKMLKGMARKRLAAGDYACCVTKTYGSLAGVLEKLHRWISAGGRFRLDEERQWFAEYRVLPGMDIERDAIVKVCLPIQSEERE